MKKLLVLLGILAAFSFVACNKEADPINPPASDPIENPTDTPETPDTPDVPETPAFDGKIDLTGKMVKNEAAFTRAYDGFLITFDAIDVTDYTSLKVGAKFYDKDGSEIAANWGLAQYLLLRDPSGSWDGDNKAKDQYNLGMQDMDLSGVTGNVAAIVVQNSTADVCFIEVTSIEFVK